MEPGNTDDSFITLNSIKKSKGKKLLVNGEINFKSKYDYMKRKLHVLSQEQLIDISLTDRSWQIRRLALRHINNPSVVFKIAYNDKSPHIREYFLKNFNQAALKHIALTDPSLEVRKSSIKYINDIELLKNLALNDSSFDVRMEASDKLKDDEFFKKLIQSESYRYDKAKIIKKIDNQKTLFDFYSITDSYVLKEAIIEGLSNQEYIFDLYVMEDLSFFRELLISRFDGNDEDILLKAFNLETDLKLKKLILNKFNRKELYYEKIFLNDLAHHFSGITVEYIRNQEILLDVIYGDYDDETRLKAVCNLNQENLFNICDDLSLDEFLRFKAVSIIENENYLMDICEKSRNVSLILSAFSSIKNHEFISGFGLNHDNWKVRSLAIAKTDDKDSLAEIASDETCWFARKMVVKKIKDDGKLVEILKNEKNRQVQKVIINSIESPEILLDLFKSDYLNLFDIKSIERFAGNEDILTPVALNHNLESLRKKAVSLIESEETLKFIAMNDESFDVQSLALLEYDSQYRRSNGKYSFNPTFRFIDEDVFYKYLMNNKDNNSTFFESIVKESIKHMKNPSYLMDMALNSVNPAMFYSAVNSNYFDMNNVDEKKFFDFIMNYDGEFPDMLNEAVKFISDENYLFQIVNSSHLELSVKTLAVDAIYNQDMLEEIVLNHSDAYVRNQAIKNIEDKNLIKYLALNDPSHIVRKSTLSWNQYGPSKYSGARYERVGDSEIIISAEEVFEEILLKSDDARIRSLALIMISDDERLSRIAVTSRDVEVRNKATQSIKRQDVLMNIALRDPSRIVKTSAIDSITEANLIKIVKDFKDWYVRDYALKQINDEPSVIDLAFHDSNWHVRHTAVLKIFDENILKDIALSDTNINVRKSAIERITGKEILNEILKKTTHCTTPGIVKSKLGV
ncbi:HEAT repeat domain-containing protein [Methanobrevibacter sp.]|uniref:HEAT repeat domain-containing protein n=1 Tax=Methanobrevibacter sp. TaxID=66852 RepID=UPI00388F4627